MQAYLIDVLVSDVIQTDIIVNGKYLDCLSDKAKTDLRNIANKILRTLPQTQWDQAIESKRR